MRAITVTDFELDGVRYHITLGFYDEEKEFYTAEWWGENDRKKCSLGYGVGSAQEAELLAVKMIQKSANP